MTKTAPIRCSMPLSSRRQDLLELLQQLAVAGEIAGRVFPLHVAEDRPGAGELVLTGRGGRRLTRRLGRVPDQEGLRRAEGVAPFDLAVVGKQLAEHGAGERRNAGLL